MLSTVIDPRLVPKRIRLAVAVCLAAGPFCASFAQAAAPAWMHFQGMCDASALEMLDGDRFVTGNDEDNVLRIYSKRSGGLPVQTLDFSLFYRLPKAKQEIDLEGSARIGERIYWISSHGANAKGKFQPSRHRLFTTDIVSSNGVVRLQPAGVLYSSLLRDLMREPGLASLGLGAAARRPPKSAGALNIEGLAATSDGQLLIGFRNPIPQGKALVVALTNPGEVVAGRPARFGAKLMIDLGGLGIRSIAPFRDGFLIVAGSFDGDGPSRLYRWDGRSGHAAPWGPPLPGNPEALAVLNGPSGPVLFALSDDGTRKIGGTDCKKVKDSSVKVFRGFELPLAGYESVVSAEGG